MEAIGVAANLIAVVDLSARIAKCCIQYSLEVKDAKADIMRVQTEVDNLEKVVSHVQRLISSPQSAHLTASEKMLDAVNDCLMQLKTLEEELAPSKTRKTMSRLGLRALKWPFKSKNVDKVIQDLERCKGAILLALQVDQTELVQNIRQKIDLSKLLFVEGAAFDSYVDELDARCHPDTRIDLLRHIIKWGDDPQGKCIFWLSGMAGTGKSTVARTAAQLFADDGKLGASFFFKRGEGERGNASKFFTTIAAQLVRTVPAITPHLSKAIEADPSISGRMIKKQFGNLVLQPLSEVGRTSTTMLKLVIVIDALDECEPDGDLRNILHLLPQIQHLNAIHMRIFLTSRPELPIRLGFRKMSSNTHQDVILQDIPRPIIEHDITSFLKAEFYRIRDDFNCTRPPDSSIPEDWPGEGSIHTLTEMASPLFIFAATICRFVGDARWDPKEQLAMVLKYKATSQASQMDGTYLPVLDKLLHGLAGAQKDRLVREFRDIVGSIVVLASALSAVSLAGLLDVPRSTIDCSLDPLHSVLSIPANPNKPIRLLHLSFREFLLDPEKQGRTPFWVGKIERHDTITTKCLELMSKHLQRNICHLDFPGKLRREVSSETVDKFLPAEVQYACQYWVYHLQESKRHIRDQNTVHVFLLEHLLHWLEAMSLIGKISESIAMIASLHSLLQTNESTEAARFISDARCFILQNVGIIDIAPLQIYSSAIAFAPKESIVRSMFEQPIPWISMLPKVPRTWDPELRRLPGYGRDYNTVAFSPDGQLLVFEPLGNNPVRIWNPVTGEVVHELRCNLNTVAFSPDGRLLALSSGKAIKLWDPATGEQLRSLKGHKSRVKTIVFSPCSQLIASVCQYTVRLWDAATGEQVQLLEGYRDRITEVAFSPSSQMLALALMDMTIRLWKQSTSEQVLQLEAHDDRITAITFSPDGQLLASTSKDKTVKLWNPATGEQQWQTEDHVGHVNIAFSPDGQLFMSSDYKTIRLWNPATGRQLWELDGHRSFITTVVFSPDGQLLASASDDKTVMLWNPFTGEPVRLFEGHDGCVSTVVFSPDGLLLASASSDGTVRLWNPAIGNQVQHVESHDDTITSTAFSPDGQFFASASRDSTVRLWNPTTGDQMRLLRNTDWVTAVAFSPDGRILASATHDGSIRLWNPVTGEEMLKFTHGDTVHAIAFSPDGQLLASASQDETVRLWKVATGEPAQVQQLKGHVNSVSAVAFSPNGKLIASASHDETVRIWNPATGKQKLKLSHGDSVIAVAFSPDDQLLASASWDRTLTLWNLAMGNQMYRLRLSYVVHQLHFSSDGQGLVTDKGTLRPTSHSVTSRSTAASDIFKKGDWITFNDQNLLWLPHYYRGTRSAVRDNLLVICRNSRMVQFIEFNPSQITV